MKKIIVTLAIAISSLSAFAGEESIAPKVLDAFKNEFISAKEVEWTAGADYYKATFTYNDRHVFAFYNADGELLALTRNISSSDLPLNLQSDLKKENYTTYWISDLFEAAKDGITEYYVTLENAGTKIVLKSTNGSEWNTYKKTRKI
jgi:hypothetical protein